MTERQAQNIEAAIPVIPDKGIAVSTAAIAKTAGVSNGTSFNSFGTKQDLIDTIYLNVKTEMYVSLTNSRGAAFNRDTLRRDWCDYIKWSRRKPHHRQIMHLVLNAGLVSSTMQKRAAEVGAPCRFCMADALEQGLVLSPSVDYLARLIFFNLHLVIEIELVGSDEMMTFHMLCNSIGLTK